MFYIARSLYDDPMSDTFVVISLRPRYNITHNYFWIWWSNVLVTCKEICSICILIPFILVSPAISTTPYIIRQPNVSINVICVLCSQYDLPGINRGCFQEIFTKEEHNIRRDRNKQAQTGDAALRARWRHGQVSYVCPPAHICEPVWSECLSNSFVTD